MGSCKEHFTYEKKEGYWLIVLFFGFLRTILCENWTILYKLLYDKEDIILLKEGKKITDDCEKKNEGGKI